MYHWFQKFAKQPALWQVALASYWLALFTLTHMPLTGSTPMAIPWADKLAHFVAFAILAVLFATTWELSAGQLTASHLRRAWIVLALYSAIDEWTQPLAGRKTSLWDWICDVIGALAGLVAFALVRNCLRRKSRRAAA